MQVANRGVPQGIALEPLCFIHLREEEGGIEDLHFHRNSHKSLNTSHAVRQTVLRNTSAAHRTPQITINAASGWQKGGKGNDAMRRMNKCTDLVV